MKKLIPLLFLAPCIAFGQLTYVPDDNFEQALIDLGYDTGPLDDSVPTANINTVAGLNVNSKNISDLTGIADFSWLLSLDCFSNNLDSLDLSHSNNLQHLDCSGNPLVSLDISGAANLEYLYCDFCQLTTLDVTNNIYLEELDIEVNQFQSIDISQNINLLEFYCTYNQLTDVDVSHMGSLTVLQCNVNELICLNVANGNNDNMNLIAYNNPNLTCIEVDDTTWAIANWTPAGLNIDSTASFSDDCSSTCFPGFPQPDCSLLEVTGVAIDDSNMTIDITIYNGNTIQINYPYIGLVVDAMGDTIQNGFSNFFMHAGEDTMTYPCTLNSVSPVYPLTVYFAYSDMMGGMGTDTCVLSYAGPIFPQLCSYLEVTDVAIDDSNMTIDISIYYGNMGMINYPHIGLVVDAMGDTIQNGFINFFVHLGGDTMTYSYTLNSPSPVYPLTVYFAYSDMSGGVDTCVLSYAAPVGIPETPTKDKELLYITDILGRTTHPVPNRVLFYIYDDGSVEKKIRLER